MIITVTNIKGGCGKTTISVNLACLLALYKRKVLLVDADVQGTASTFRAMRADHDVPQFASVQMLTKTAGSDIREMANQYDDIVIDTGGRDTGVARSVMIASHVVVIPVIPASYDIWSTEQTLDQVREVHDVRPDLPVFGVFNLYKTTKEGAEADKIADDLKKDYSIHFLDVRLHDRVAYKRGSEGLSIFEIKPSDPKAVDEFKSFVKEINGRLK